MGGEAAFAGVGFVVVGDVEEGVEGDVAAGALGVMVEDFVSAAEGLIVGGEGARSEFVGGGEGGDFEGAGDGVDAGEALGEGIAELVRVSVEMFLQNQSENEFLFFI